MDLTLLKDDKNFFPNYALVPMVRSDHEGPSDLKDILESLSTKLDDSVMQYLNGESGFNVSAPPCGRRFAPIHRR